MGCLPNNPGGFTTKNKFLQEILATAGEIKISHSIPWPQNQRKFSPQGALQLSSVSNTRDFWLHENENPSAFAKEED